MPSRRVIRSVLHNFLGTLTSRNSDHRGDWIFGVFFADLEFEVDLLEPVTERTHPLIALSALRFREQLDKSRLPIAKVQQAILKISSGLSARSWINGQLVDGSQVVVRVSVLMDNARVYDRQQTILVTPHDKNIELRRHPTGQN